MTVRIDRSDRALDAARQPSAPLLVSADATKLISRVCRQLRDLAWGPEEVVVAMKQVARDAGLSEAYTFGTGHDLTSRHVEFMTLMVEQCIVDYYSDG